jgi:molybdenum cofactor cytidylyltransferase
MPTRPDVVLAVLAAGASRRLGRPKQLVPIDGEPLVRRTTRVCADVGETVVVVGANAEAVQHAVDDLPVRVVRNDAWPRGMGASIARATAVTAPSSALLVVPCDLVALRASHLAAMIDAYAGGASLVVSAYDGTRGPPALFGPAYRAALLALDGDHGLREVVRGGHSATAVPFPEGALDMDTAEDLLRVGVSP